MKCLVECFQTVQLVPFLMFIDVYGFFVQALDTFNAAIVSPVYYVMFTTLTIIASAIMFKVECSTYPVEYFFFFMLQHGPHSYQETISLNEILSDISYRIGQVRM